MGREPVNISYFRLGLSGVERVDILKFVKEKKMGDVLFVEENADREKNWNNRKIGKLINSLKSGDRIIVPELTRLGRSTIEVLEILRSAIKKEIEIFSVRDGFELNDAAMHQATMISMFSFFSTLEKEFVSHRTKKALKARKVAGVKLGRPKGPGRSKLDVNRENIIALLKNGSTKAYIARKYKTTIPNLYNWLKKNDINVKPDY